MIDATYFHGSDGLGNNNFPDEESGISNLEENYEERNIAAEEIIKFCLKSYENNEQTTLVMLGPLTNLAHAMAIQEDLVNYIDSIVIMGGCGNGHGNVGRTTEFNISADCEAASIVFNNLLKYNKKCTIVSWELTLANTIPWSLFDQLNSEETDKLSTVSHFLREISQFSYHPSKRQSIPHFSIPSEHFHGAVICDALAIAVALNPSELIQYSQAVHVDVELNGELTRGQTVVDWGCYDGVIRTKNCDWILQLNTEVFIDMFRYMYFSE